MSKLIVYAFAMSIDGYSAGPHQDLENPLGVRGPELMDWFFQTRVWQRMQPEVASLKHHAATAAGETGVDNRMAERGFENVGAWIMGRNMFGPVRGSWPDDIWKGWWGDNPPFHEPVFVLTHYARAPITMQGGTTFHFVTDGIQSALDQARAASGDRDIRLGGGVATVRQYLKARLIDELHIPLRPILLGAGENLMTGINLRELGYECTESVAGDRAFHVTLRKRASS